MTIEQAIAKQNDLESYWKMEASEQYAAEHRQIAEWLRILKKAKFEYDEAWQILTHPTPDVRYPDIDRAKMILDVFRDSLGRME